MKKGPLDQWTPVALLLLGGALLFTVGRQQRPELEAPLASALPTEIQGMPGHDEPISEVEAQLAGFTDYAFRIYGEPLADTTSGQPVETSWASIYLGFYSSQTDGRTIHSPRNCLPGAGWEALSSTTETIESTAGEAVQVNRYVLQNGDARALVLYWYQGRGRVAHNEYLVKWDLLRDAAVLRRTDEALVRIVVPIQNSEDTAFAFAREIAAPLISDVDAVLPPA